MLYSESIERPMGAALTAKTSWAEKWSWSALRTWMEAPVFDAAVALGASSVVVSSAGRRSEFPALLAFNARGKCLATGLEAQALEGKEPEGVTIQQPLRHGTVHDPHGARLLLQKAVRGGASRLLLATGAHPTALERETWEALGRSVGARQVALVSELLASAVGAGLDVLKPRCQLVLHIGAGRCEVGVLALGACLSVRKGDVAGTDVTQAIQEYVRRTYHLLIHRQDAERLKRELSVCSSEAELPVSGRHLESGAPLRVNLKAGEIHPLVEGFYSHWTDLVRAFLADMPIDWLDDVQATGIHLTGGCTSLYGLSAALKEATGLRIVRPEQPEGCAAAGLQSILRSPQLRRALFGHTVKPKDDFAEQPVTLQRSSLVWTLAAGLLAVTLAASAASARALTAGGPDPWLGPLAGLAAVAPAARDDAPQASAVLNREEKRQLASLRAENGRLWGWLGRREAAPKVNSKAGQLARVIGRDGVPWLAGVRLDVGKAQGIKVRQLVMADRGLLGRVVQVDDATCRVQLLLAPTMVSHGAVAARHTSGVLSGSGLPTLSMTGLDPDSHLKAGDLVTTSGQDGKFPRGLPLGRIAAFHIDPKSGMIDAQVKPLAQIDDVSEVMVLR